MLRIKNIHQEGLFKYFDGNAVEHIYTLQIMHSEAKELYNFYENSELVSSVFREYKSNYTVETRIFGNPELFNKYEQCLLSVKFLKTYKISEKAELCEYGKRIISEVSTINPKLICRSRGAFEVEEYVQRTVLVDKKRVDFYIKHHTFEIDIKSKEINFKTKILPLDSVDYDDATSLVQQRSSAALANIRTLDQIGKEIDVTWLETKRYYVVQTWEQFIKMVEFLRNFDDPIAVDTETEGLKINRLPLNHPDRDNITGICISWAEDEGYYIPLRQKLFTNLPEQDVMNKLRFILETKHIVTHYGIFDWKVFWGYGINLNILDDTYTLQFMIDPKGAKACKKLKQMTKAIFGVDQIELELFFPKIGKKKQQISFGDLPLEAVQAYGPADTDFTMKIFNYLRPQLPQSMEYIYGQEIMLIRNIAYTEYYGIRIDLVALKEENEKTLKKAHDLEQTIYREACVGLGIPLPPKEFNFSNYKLHKKSKTDTVESLLRSGVGFNIASSPQLIELLYDKMKIPKLAYTKKNGEETTTPSTSIKTFALYKDVKNADDSPRYPIMNYITDFKKATKLITSFFTKLYNDMLYVDFENPVGQRKIGFIFPHYNPAGAESGRIAGYAPNLQQTAGSIRRLFISDSENHYLVDCDYSQIEYRVMASLAKEDKLMEKFIDPEVDFHTVMAALLFGIPEEEVTPEKRKQSKALNFGIPYGMGDYSLAAQLFGKVTDATVAEAGAKKTAYLASVPQLREFFRVTKEFVQQKGYVLTAFGRRRQFPEIFGTDKRKIEAAKRQAGNTRIQGTAADIMKIAYNRVCDRLAALKFIFQTTKDENGYIIPKDPIYRVAGSIHDELLCVCSKKINPWYIIYLMRGCMEIKLPGFAPLFIGAVVGNSWADGKDPVHELPIYMIDRHINELLHEGKHREPLENPERDVFNAIYDYINELLFRDFEKVGILANTRINLSHALKVVTNSDTLGLVTKYYGIKDKIDKKKFDVTASLENCLKKLYGDDMVYTAEEVDEHRLFEYVHFDEHTEFAELVLENDGALDEDLDEYHEEEISIDYAALNKLALKDGELKIESVNIVSAKDSYMTTERVIVLQGDCYINVTGLEKARTALLAEYLKRKCTPNGFYRVVLELNDEEMPTKFKLPIIPRSELAEILEGELDKVKLRLYRTTTYADGMKRIKMESELASVDGNVQNFVNIP